MTGTTTDTNTTSMGRRALVVVACLVAGIASSFVLHAVLSSDVESAPTNALRDHEPDDLELRVVSPTEAELAGNGGSEGMRAAAEAIRAAAMENGWEVSDLTASAIGSDDAAEAYSLSSVKDTTEVDVSPVERVSGSPFTDDGTWLLRLSSRTTSQDASRFIVNGFAIAMAPVFAGLYLYGASWIRRFRNTNA